MKYHSLTSISFLTSIVRFPLSVASSTAYKLHANLVCFFFPSSSFVGLFIQLTDWRRKFLYVQAFLLSLPLSLCIALDIEYFDVRISLSSKKDEFHCE